MPISLHETCSASTAHVSRELHARGCESALWLAVLSAQDADLPDLVARISALHAEAGERRRDLEDQ